MAGTTVVVRRGNLLGNGYRRRLTEVSVRAFTDDFVPFSRDARRLADAFGAHAPARAVTRGARGPAASPAGEPEYREHVLEDIKDTNAPALGLDSKLGFTVYECRTVRFARRARFTELMSVTLTQDPRRSPVITRGRPRGTPLRPSSGSRPVPCT